MKTSEAQPRIIAVLTTGRQDWGIVRSTCEAIVSDPTAGMRLHLIAGGMHVSRRHGRTVDHVRADGFEPDAELAWLDADDREVAPEVQASRALRVVGEHLRTVEPDAIVIAGDRLETLAAATGATLVTVPIVHLHGGEQTEGLFDDAIRHAITKLAHLHLVSNEEHALRVIALGEDPASVHVVGAPSLDALARTDLADPAELEAFLGIPLERPLVIVTLHPTTLDSDPSAVAEPLVAALDRVRATYVITLPNADPGNQRIRTALIRAASESSSRVAVEALGERRYWGLMRHADAMIGNSSSGLIEAPALSLPAVNVGDRQAGRHRGANVIDCEASVDAISEALRHALDPQTRAALRSQPGLHLDGRTGVRIKERIAAWHPSHPPRKPLIAVDGRK